MIKIGLEIHCQLTSLKSKLFCSCKNDYREFKPNANICPICIGLPGTLPKLNKSAIKKSIIVALALNCTIPKKIAFYRKNYFYPDLPKNFQITQINMEDDTCIGNNGKIKINNKDIRIERIQLEEDPGKISYKRITDKSQLTLIDYNRSGVSLIEIVTKPDFRNNRDIKEFLNKLFDLLVHLDILDPDLSGSIRMDVNISIDNNKKTELKNINSIHSLEKAVKFEVTRQQSFINRHIQIKQETRHWDNKRKITISARTKEEEKDYRYFIECDIPVIIIDNDIIYKLKKNMPENIIIKKLKYLKYGISDQVIDTILSDRYYTELFEQSCNEKNAKYLANIITTYLIRYLNTKEKRLKSKLTPQHLTKLTNSIDKNKLILNSVKSLLLRIIKTGESLDDILSKSSLNNSFDNDKLLHIINTTIDSEKKLIEQIKKNPNIINYIIGKVMKKTNGNVEPNKILEILKNKLM